MQEVKRAGFKVGRYRTRSIMHKLKLVVVQRQAYKVTTKRKHTDSVADNLLNQHFNPKQENLVWAHLFEDQSRLDVLSHCHGFILSSGYWLVYNSPYDG